MIRLFRELRRIPGAKASRLAGAHQSSVSAAFLDGIIVAGVLIHRGQVGDSPARVVGQAAGQQGDGQRQVTAGHLDWLTVIQLPASAPDLNPVEGVWSSMKSSLGNLAACTLDRLTATIRNRLRRIQRQPALISAFIGQTGLTLESQPP
jgi:hypothetical protein